MDKGTRLEREKNLYSLPSGGEVLVLMIACADASRVSRGRQGDEERPFFARETTLALSSVPNETPYTVLLTPVRSCLRACSKAGERIPLCLD